MAERRKSRSSNVSINQTERNFAKWTMIATVVISLSTVANVVISGFLWKSTKNQSEYTRYIFETSQRPYVGFFSTSIFLNSNSKNLLYYLHFVNTGSIPAQNVLIDVESHVNNNKLQPVGEIPKPTIIFPQGRILRRGGISGDQFDLVIRGTSVLRVDSTVTYQGPKGSRYTCKQSVQYDPTSNTFFDLGATCP